MSETSSASTATPSQPLLEISGLTVDFYVGRRVPRLRAVDGVDLTVAPRETVGLVGESGSGKSTIGRAVLGLTPIDDGVVRFDGVDLATLNARARRALSRDLQVVFQDPFSSLSATRTIGQTLGETLRVHEKLSRSQLQDRVRTMLERVGLPADAATRYPAQFSGGQRQRIAIARALMASPRLVICDEAVSALDLSVQAQILNLLRDLQREFETSYLFIAHDLAVVRHVSQRVVVLYRGRMMEEGGAEAVYTRPAHPYTRALLMAAPVPDPAEQRARRLARSAVNATRPAPQTSDSCPFTARCTHAMDRCYVSRPQLESTGHGTRVACHRWRELVHEPTMVAVSGPAPPAGIRQVT